ncbi:BLUF domain-containing protein [Brevundimonas sp.]|uniref:BLUF domain-containing protein n=1 Tax=Brevundimonas sp. TaxID=1871086 RepID=UPI00286A5C85|nr:BLUF domain-containing protein [Brevundimonas sp.]
MPNSLHRLSYLSVATLKPLSLIGLAELLAISQRNNDRDGLTGALAVSKSQYFGVVEGPRDNLFSLVARLQRDRRHRDIHILELGPASARIFGRWSLVADLIEPSLVVSLADLMIPDALAVETRLAMLEGLTGSLRQVPGMR